MCRLPASSAAAAAFDAAVMGRGSRFSKSRSVNVGTSVAGVVGVGDRVLGRGGFRETTTACAVAARLAGCIKS